MGWKVFIDRKDFSSRTELRIGHLDDHGSLCVMEPAKVSVISRGMPAPDEPFMVTGRYAWDEIGLSSVENFLQAIVDAAWDFGIKPKQVAALPEPVGDRERAAMQAHIDDLRRVAFEVETTQFAPRESVADTIARLKPMPHKTATEAIKGFHDGILSGDDR